MIKSTIGKTTMTDEFKNGARQFGFANIITICIVVASAIFNYAQMDSRVNVLEERVAQEVIDRRVADEKIRIEIDNFYDRNAEDHQRLLDGITNIQKDLTFHLGIHEGKVNE